MTHQTPDQLAVENWIRDLWEWGRAEAASGIRAAWVRRLRWFAAGEVREPFNRIIIEEALPMVRAEAAGGDLPDDDREAAERLADRLESEIEAGEEIQRERLRGLAEAAGDIWQRLAAIDPETAAGPAARLECWLPGDLPPISCNTAWAADGDLERFAPMLWGDEETALARLRGLADDLRRSAGLVLVAGERFEAERLANKARAIAAGAGAAVDPAPGADPEPEAALPDDMGPADWLAELPPAEREILAGLRTGPATRVVLAGRINRDRNAIAPSVRRLIRLGLVEASGQRQPLRLTATGREAHRSISEAASKAAGKAVRR